jgi:O-antigen ligase
VKDYLIQGGEFVLCAFALAHLAINAWSDRRRRLTVGFLLLALAFVANIAFVAIGRSTLFVVATLLVLFAVQRFPWRGIVGVMLAGVILTSLAWASSPQLRERVLSVSREIQDYRFYDANNSAGLRLEFWKKSIEFVAAAPVFDFPPRQSRLAVSIKILRGTYDSATAHAGAQLVRV